MQSMFFSLAVYPTLADNTYMRNVHPMNLHRSDRRTNEDIIHDNVDND